MYKSIYQDGKLLEKIRISTSTYRTVRGEVRVGTKKADVPAKTPETTQPATEANNSSFTK